MSTKLYAAINRNDDVRDISSSGAVFYELARNTIEHNGVVFGVAYDEDWNAIHLHSETLNGCMAFLGSKYVQSGLRDEYVAARDMLKQGRRVLFSGTPCQIAGLKAFLGENYDNLITMDFICHGVPSPAVWRAYCDYISGNRMIADVSFRDKTEGWLDFSLKVDFTNGDTHRQTQHTDLYLRGFLQNLYLRPSCYECRFRGVDRVSDFTLADFWGVNDELPEMFDDKGTSVVLIHSAKGELIWKEIEPEFISREISVETVYKKNKNLVQSVPIPEKREVFFRKEIGNFKTLEVLLDGTKIEKVIRKIKRVIKK